MDLRVNRTCPKTEGGACAARASRIHDPLPSKNRGRGEVPEWSIGTVSKTVVPSRVPWVRIPPSPPLSCSEPEMRLPLGAIFFLFQRRLADAAEPRRLAPGPISVSERPSVSNRANLVRPGSASRSLAFPAGFAGRSTMDSAGALPVGIAFQRTLGRHIWGKPGAVLRYTAVPPAFSFPSLGALPDVRRTCRTYGHHS